MVSFRYYLKILRRYFLLYFVDYSMMYSDNDVAGGLLHELVSSLVLIQQKIPTVIHEANIVSSLNALLDSLDSFNKFAPGLEHQDSEDFAWPGIWGKNVASYNLLFCS